jgi:hypothetical protein
MPQTKRQADITTLLLAFENFFPGVEPPHIKYVCAWLYRLPVESVLDCMERVSIVDAENPFPAPAAALWKVICNEAPAMAETVRYDAEGQRCESQ